jgi:MFS family permease
VAVSAEPRVGRDFRLLIVARSVSWAGSAVSLVALPMAVYQQTGDARATAALAAVGFLPYLAFGLPAGVVADRWPRRAMMSITATLAGVATAAVPVCAWFGVRSTVLLFVVAGVTATLMVFYDAAGFGLLPALVPRDGLPAAIAKATAASTVINMSGPAVGGVLAAMITPESTLAVDAVSFLVAAAVLAGIREPARHRPVRSPVVREVAEGLRFLVRQAVIRSLTLIGIGISLVMGMVSGVLVATVVERFGLPSDDPRIGLAYTALGVGAVLASVALPAMARRHPVDGITIGALSVALLGLLGWAVSPTFAAGLGFLVVWQAGNSLVIVNSITVRNQLTPDSLQGRVNTTARMIAIAGQPVGAGVAGVLVGQVGLQPLLFLACGVTVATIGWAARAPLRHG